MIKKLLLVAVIGTAALVGLKQTKLFGYAKQEVESLKTWAEEQVPVEKEISRLRKEVAGLDGDVKKVSTELAKEIVEVRYLREQTEEIKTGVATEEDALRVRADAIKAAGEVKAGEKAPAHVNYGRLKLTPNEAKDHLAADVQRVVARKGTLTNLEKTLELRERNKENLEKTLDALKKQKLEMTSQIDAFEAEFKALQLQQIESKYQTDSTRLASIKESLRGLKKKIDIQREQLNLEPKVQEESPTGGAASKRSVEEILAPLDGKKADAPAKKTS